MVPMLEKKNDKKSTRTTRIIRKNVNVSNKSDVRNLAGADIGIFAAG